MNVTLDIAKSRLVRCLRHCQIQYRVFGSQAHHDGGRPMWLANFPKRDAIISPRRAIESFTKKHNLGAIRQS